MKYLGMFFFLLYDQSQISEDKSNPHAYGIIISLVTGFVRILKTLEFLESLYKALRVLEILFHSFWSFKVLILIEEHFEISKKLGQIPV